MGGKRRSHIRGNTNMQVCRSMQEPQCDIFYSSVASQLEQKHQSSVHLVGICPKRVKLSFEQWVFKVKHVMQSNKEAFLREWTVC